MGLEQEASGFKGHVASEEGSATVANAAGVISQQSAV
jgi:hypothetical protein